MKKVKKIVILMTVLLVNSCGYAFAAEPQIVTGTKNFFNDLLKWILILVPVGSSAMVAYHAIMKGLSEGEPAVVADRNKKIKNVLIAAAIAETSAGLVNAFLNYFK